MKNEKPEETISVGEKTYVEALMRAGHIEENIPEDFEALKEIARGGMGVVYRARQKSLDRVVAIKTILAGVLATESQVQRFRIEAQAAAKLEHPGIVSVYQIGEQNGQHFFSMAYVDGRSLAEVLRDQGALPQNEAARLALQIAEAVAYAHEQEVIHRDIKPGNILLDQNGAPRLTDFGLAKLSDDSELTATGVPIGTPSFMSPEQASGLHSQVGSATDIYAIGAVLYAMLTGRPPFQGPSVTEVLLAVRQQSPIAPSKLTAGIDHDLETICLKCLEKSPADRYAQAAELSDDLNRFLRDEPIKAKPVGVIRSAWRWYTGSRESAVWAAGGFAFILGFILLVWNVTGLPAVLVQSNYKGVRIRSGIEIGVSLFFCIPLMLAGYYTLRRRPWAVLAGLIASIAITLMVVLVWLGYVRVEAHQSEPFNALSALLLINAIIALVLFATALFSQNTNARKRNLVTEYADTKAATVEEDRETNT